MPFLYSLRYFHEFQALSFIQHLKLSRDFSPISLDEESSRLTSFMTPFDKYRWLRMPMGICNAPELFHQQMLDAMEGLDVVEVYIDDLLVHASTMEEHDRRLEIVLDRCRQVGLTLNSEKMELAKESTSFLGHELSQAGLKPSHSKVEAVQLMTVPEDKKAVQRFLGFVNFMAKFIPNLSQHTYPL